MAGHAGISSAVRIRNTIARRIPCTVPILEQGMQLGTYVSVYCMLLVTVVWYRGVVPKQLAMAHEAIITFKKAQIHHHLFLEAATTDYIPEL
jgi:hypothetical protein